MATHSNGISALQLQNQLGLGSYRTALMIEGFGKHQLHAFVLGAVAQTLLATGRTPDDLGSGFRAV